MNGRYKRDTYNENARFWSGYQRTGVTQKLPNGWYVRNSNGEFDSRNGPPPTRNQPGPFHAYRYDIYEPVFKRIDNELYRVYETVINGITYNYFEPLGDARVIGPSSASPAYTGEVRLPSTVPSVDSPPEPLQEPAVFQEQDPNWSTGPPQTEPQSEFPRETRPSFTNPGNPRVEIVDEDEDEDDDEEESRRNEGPNPLLETGDSAGTIYQIDRQGLPPPGRADRFFNAVREGFSAIPDQLAAFTDPESALPFEVFQSGALSRDGWLTKKILMPVIMHTLMTGLQTQNIERYIESMPEFIDRGSIENIQLESEHARDLLKPWFAHLLALGKANPPPHLRDLIRDPAVQKAADHVASELPKSKRPAARGRFVKALAAAIPTLYHQMFKGPTRPYPHRRRRRDYVPPWRR